MESNLFDIPEEDDSLLLQRHQIQNDHVSPFKPSFFSCSPLHLPRSNPPGEKAKNPSLSSNIDKENINNHLSKPEVKNLSLEPQKMKRKKKGGGYNLRKSLAWDRAFFTEEGVLSSTELSLISGSGGKLSVIEEERGESLVGDSPDLEVLENNLFKELPLNNCNKNEEKKIGSRLLHKSSGSAPCSAVKQNVLSVHDVNRSGSKRSGCPRPVISSALKRPANVSTTKAAVKEPKFSKLPTPKPDSGVLSTIAKSAPNINKPKGNQSAQAGSRKSTRSTQGQNDAKSSLSSRSQITKSSAQHNKRNAGSSALASHSSTSLQHPLVTKVDNGIKVNQDPVVAAGHGSINHEAGSRKIASLPLGACHIDGNSQYAQPRMAKPSGLRMPSPSLGFFTRSKTNASQNVRSTTQPCNNPKSNIDNLRKLGVLSSISESHTPSMKVPIVANGVAVVKDARMSSSESSVPSSVNSLYKNVRPSLQMPRMEMKVLCNSDNLKIMNNQQELHTIDNDLKQQIENVGLQYTDNRLHLESQSSEELKLYYDRSTDLVISHCPDQHGDEFKDPHLISHHSVQIKGASKTDVVGHQLSGNERHNSLTEHFDLFPELHSSDVNRNTIHGSSEVNNDQVSSTHDSHEQPSKQAEQAKPCTVDDDQMISKIKRQYINDCDMLKEGEALEEFASNSIQSNGICQKVRDCSASEMEWSNCLSHNRNRIQGKDSAGEAADFNLKSHVGDAQVHSFQGDLALENSSGLLNASEADNRQLLVDDVNKELVEQPLPDPSITVERAFQDNYGSHSTDRLLLGENVSSEEFLAESNLQSVKDVASEVADACQSEPRDPSAPCSVLPALQNGSHEMSDVVECLYVEHPVSVSTDTQCNNDIELPCEATSEGLESVGEDQLTGSIIACDISVSNYCQSSGYPNDGEIDHLHSISCLGRVHLLKGYSEMDDIIDLKSFEGKQYDLSSNCESEVKLTSCHGDTSAILTNSSLDKQYDHERSVVQAELIQSSFEASKASPENQIPKAYDSLLSVKGNFFEESHNLDSDNRADISPKDKSSVRQVVESPFDLSQVERIDQPSETCAVGANEITTRSFEEDVHSQSFDDIIPLDSCKSNLFTSAENNSSAMVVEDLIKPPVLQNVVIIEQILPDKIGLSVNQEVSSSAKIVPDNNHDMIFRLDSEQSGQAASLSFDLSSSSEDISGAGNTCDSQALCSLNEESTSSIKAGQTLSSGIDLQEEVNRLEKNVPQELNCALIPVEDKGTTTSPEKNGSDNKQDAPVVKPPLNSVPFSDEWLAAFEAAGEEILTMKSGAVQHSPKDKSLPEPGPWSPVRRKKNQELGPFDCTKFTNTNIPPGSD